jgi:2-oxoisovalerate dehydrogenase E1 component alpha subunit
MDYCRQERKPYMLEALVSRLYGHSSSSGALRVKSEPDCIAMFEKRLLEYKLIDEAGIDEIHSQAQAEVETAADQALAEPKPKPGDEKLFTYAPSPVDAVYPGDYTGLP